ncbi:MAG: NHL repeat-containing protein [Acidobacteriota bacterium]|nr:NHL repeat-containing protein [Acidobacteriota bacterium]
MAGKRSRSSLTWALAFVAFVGVVSLAVFLLFYLTEKPRPTIVGWRATVTTHAGDGAPGVLDGAAQSQARFADPFGVAVDRAGNVYVADGGDSNRIRKIAPEGIVSTFAGWSEGRTDGQGSNAAFDTPSGIATDSEGNFYVADTGNNRVRKITPEGVVSIVAGDGVAGHADGAAESAQFNAPIGVAVDRDDNVFVADTYNDRIRKITTDGQVTTLAGGAKPGYADGPAQDALFDTPCGVAVNAVGEIFVADTGNNLIRKLTKDGQVVTLHVSAPGAGEAQAFDAPTGLVVTHDNFIYVSESNRGRVVQIAPDNTVRLIAGAGRGFADGDGQERARFNGLAGIAVDRSGALYAADSANYLVRKIAPAENTSETTRHESTEVLPRLDAAQLAPNSFPWPIDPQNRWHELVATMGEVRGSYDGESRHHLHAGIDVQAGYGAKVHAVRNEKVSDPLGNWGFGSLNEGMSAGLMTYVHMRVGRDEKDEPLESSSFIALRNDDGKVERIRVKRGTRLRVGDALGTVNRMYHVHLNFGPRGAQANPLSLPFVGVSDSFAPRIERDGIQLFTPDNQRLVAKRDGRLLVRGDVRIIVDAYDQVDGNLPRRRLGLYKVGYQVLRPDGSPAPGFERPRITIEFDRLPPDDEAVKVAYADSSGITVYGSASTRFLYVVTNEVRGTHVREGVWRASELPPGDYILRIIAADYAGNEADAGRDVSIRNIE